MKPVIMTSTKQSLEFFMTEKNFQTTAVADFEKLLRYAVEQKGIPVSENHSLFVMKTLPALNMLLTNPIKQNQQRPLQKNFPHLHALNAVLRLSGLAHIMQNKNERLLMIDEAAYQSWNSLTNIEKYWNLLPILILPKFSEALGEQESFISSHSCLMWLVHSDHDEFSFETFQDQQKFAYTIPNHYLGFFDLFGFVTIERAEPELGRGWRFTSIKPTAFGLTIANLMLKNRAKLISDCLKGESITEARRIFHKAISPEIPSWNHNLIIFPPKPAVGLHIFKVSLHKSLKIIAIDAEETLITLAYTILDAFDFDSDHLYYFDYADWRGVPKKIYHEYVSDAEHLVDDYTIGSLNLQIGQSMTFLFDFGDNWEFHLCLEQLNPTEVIDQPKVLKSGGNPVPVQYSSQF